MAEIEKVQQGLGELSAKDAHPELSALLDVHLMLLQDEQLTSGVKHWIVERHYNAEWALTSQLEIIARQFDEMEDPYLRERKADLEQVVERMLRFMRGRGVAGGRGAVRRRHGKPPARRCKNPRWKCRWCSSHTTCRPPTCCSSSKVCSPVL